MKRSLGLIAVALAGVANANIVVPNVNTALEGDGHFSLTTTLAAGRTYQMTIASSQLASVVNDVIVGMRFRLNSGAASWPPVAASYTQWDVYLGAGVAPSAMSNTFALNFTSGATQVRSGALSFTAGSFPSGGTPNAFGPAINFTSGYHYTGGDLALEMRFSQQIGATSQSPFDAIAVTGGPGNGWGVDVAARWTGNSAGTAGVNGNFLVTEFVTEPIPEPASLLALGLGAVALLRRRKSK